MTIGMICILVGLLLSWRAHVVLARQTRHTPQIDERSLEQLRQDPRVARMLVDVELRTLRGMTASMEIIALRAHRAEAALAETVAARDDALRVCRAQEMELSQLHLELARCEKRLAASESRRRRVYATLTRLERILPRLAMSSAQSVQFSQQIRETIRRFEIIARDHAALAATFSEWLVYAVPRAQYQRQLVDPVVACDPYQSSELGAQVTAGLELEAHRLAVLAPKIAKATGRPVEDVRLALTPLAVLEVERLLAATARGPLAERLHDLAKQRFESSSGSLAPVADATSDDRVTTSPPAIPGVSDGFSTFEGMPVEVPSQGRPGQVRTGPRLKHGSASGERPSPALDVDAAPDSQRATSVGVYGHVDRDAIVARRKIRGRHPRKR